MNGRFCLIAVCGTLCLLLKPSTSLSVTSGDGLRLDFSSGDGTEVSGVSVGGVDIGPIDAEPAGFGFEVAEFLNPNNVTGIGPELIQNSNFAHAGAKDATAADWKSIGAPFTLARVSNVSRTAGGYSLMISAAGAAAGAYQHITFNSSTQQNMSNRLVLSGWSKAVGITGQTDRDYSVYCDLMYQDGSHLYGQTADYTTGTHDWQRVQHVISLTKPVHLASVYVLLRGEHTGIAYFSDISLKAAANAPKPSILHHGTTILQPDGSISMRVSAPAPISLAVEARFEGRSDSIWVTGSITRTDAERMGSSDRAVSIGLVLPVNASGWEFPSELNSVAVLGPDDDAAGLQYKNPSLPHATDYYPFLVLNNEAVGLGAGVAVDGPIFISRAKYTASSHALSVTADFALTPKATRFPNTANFTFVFFKVDTPEWGFRSALEKYYRLFPVRITGQAALPINIAKRLMHDAGRLIHQDLPFRNTRCCLFVMFLHWCLPLIRYDQILSCTFDPPKLYHRRSLPI
jgi:hypothetical protein